jgi:putative flippase GtrA
VISLKFWTSRNKTPFGSSTAGTLWSKILPNAIHAKIDAEKVRPLKFLVVGGINTLFGYLIFSLFIYLGLYYPFAVFLTTCFGIFFNFKMLSRFVFDNSNTRLIPKFIGVYAIAYFLNISIIKISSYYTTNLYIGGCIATLITAFASYYLNKNFVFRKGCELTFSNL